MFIIMWTCLLKFIIHLKPSILFWVLSENTVEKIQRFLVEALEADLFVTGPTLDSETWLQSLVLFGRRKGRKGDTDFGPKTPWLPSGKFNVAFENGHL